MTSADAVPSAEPPDAATLELKLEGSFASFQDPDGNGWLLQEIRTRLPGR